MKFETEIYGRICKVIVTSFVRGHRGVYAGHPDSRYESEQPQISWEVLDDIGELTDIIIDRIDNEAIDFVNKNGGFVPRAASAQVIPFPARNKHNIKLNQILAELKADLLKNESIRC